MYVRQRSRRRYQGHQAGSKNQTVRSPLQLSHACLHSLNRKRTPVALHTGGFTKRLRGNRRYVGINRNRQLSTLRGDQKLCAADRGNIAGTKYRAEDARSPGASTTGIKRPNFFISNRRVFSSSIGLTTTHAEFCP